MFRKGKGTIWILFHVVIHLVRLQLQCDALVSTADRMSPHRHFLTSRLVSYASTQGQENSNSISTSSKVALIAPSQLGREEVRQYIEKELLPQEHYGDRIGWGRDAHGLHANEGALRPDDPRLCQTYAEFPLSSFDELVDLGMKYVALGREDSKAPTTTVRVVDLGSGCGRLAFYCALSRGNDPIAPVQVQVAGVEIAPMLHSQAVDLMDQAIASGWLHQACPQSNVNGAANTVVLHLGSATGDQAQVISKADIIFAYSTAFSAKSFSPEVGALILDAEWSQGLSEICAPGCIVITTDRALDPQFGWEVLERRDVPNAEVLGTTGFIHRLVNS